MKMGKVKAQSFKGGKRAWGRDMEVHMRPTVCGFAVYLQSDDNCGGMVSTKPRRIGGRLQDWPKAGAEKVCRHLLRHGANSKYNDW